MTTAACSRAKATGRQPWRLIALARPRALVLLLLVLVVCGACDKGTNRIPPAAALHVGPPPTSGSTTSSAPEVAIGTPPAPTGAHAIGERVTTGRDNTLILHAYDPAVAAVSATPPPGGTLLGADIEGCAAASGSSLVPGQFTLQLDDGSRQSNVPDGRQPALGPTNVAPNTCVRGWLTFAVPAGRTPRYLVFTNASPSITIYWAA